MKLKLMKFLEKLPECKSTLKKAAINKTRWNNLTIY